MIKKLILIFFLLSHPVFAQSAISGGIQYNEITAKIEAFSNVKRKIDKEFYKDYLKDPNNKENLELIKNKIYQKDNRILCPFYLKNTLLTYAIMYDEMPLNVFYYNTLGSLVKFDIVNQSVYPRKVFGYSRFGRLISVSFEVGDNEQFVYSAKGNLKAHWKNNEAYNKNNETFKILNLKLKRYSD